MLLSELADVLDALQYTDRSLWESQRLTALMICQTHCSKKLKLTDIYKLPFDQQQSEQLTPEDIKKLRQHQQQIEDFINAQVQEQRAQKAAQTTDNKTE